MRSRSSFAMLAAAAVLLAADAPDFAAGEALFREGRFADALAVFTALEAECGDAAPAELLHARALAALGAGSPLEAEVALEKAIARGGAAWLPMRDFVAGSAAFARCERAEAQAAGPEAEPFAFDVAIAHAQAARDAWQSAAVAGSDWPEARRNVERAQAKLDALRKRRGEAIERGKQTRGGETAPPPTPDPAPPNDGERIEEAAGPLAPQVVDLAATQVDELVRRLAEKDREKLALRRTARGTAQAGVEKDW